MNQLPDGGPAYPITNTAETVREWEGISMRDYFAAHAMSGWIADPNVKARATDIARFAYQQAEAMLKERERIYTAEEEAECERGREHARRCELLREEAPDLWDGIQSEDLSFEEAWRRWGQRPMPNAQEAQR